MKIASVTPFVLTLTGLMLAPSVAEADAIDCYAPTVEIVSPAANASFEGVAEVPVTVRVQANGFDAELVRVYVLVDGQEAATMPIMGGGDYQLATAVAEGSHQLVAGATDDCAGDGSSDPVTITVTAPTGASTGEVGNGSGEDTSADTGNGNDTGGSDGGDDDDDGDGGCTMSRPPTRSWVGLSAFFLAVIGAWRLRRAGA